MPESNFVSLEVADGTIMNAFNAAPSGIGPFPGIILFMEAFGVNDHIQSIAKRLAAEGYVVIAPELYHRTAPGFTCEYTDFKIAMPHIQAMTPEGMENDRQSCWQWLQNHPKTIKNMVGTIGFCIGGRMSFLANAHLPVSAAISYYGGGIHTLTDEASNLHAPHLFFWGGQDKHILQEHIDKTIDAVKAAGKPYINTVISYADHGFHCDARASYHPQAAIEAWALTLAFFRTHLYRQ